LQRRYHSIELRALFALQALEATNWIPVLPVKWTRLSCRTFAANAVRLQLHALAYNLGTFLRTPATPEPIMDWSLTSLRRS
jgi:Transposase DDE domain group 1